MENIRFEKYWKDEINKTANYIINLYSTRITKKKRFILEKKIMSCFLHIRHYIKYYFNTDRNYPDFIKLTVYPINKQYENDSNFWKRYDLFGENKDNVTIKRLCNSFIHEKYKIDFIPAYDRMYGIFFASDDDDKQRKKLFYINLITIAQIYLTIINNREIGINISFNNDGKIKEIEYTNNW